MNRLEEDIRSGTYSRAYLLYGEESYLKEYYKKRLRQALIPEEDTMNLNVFSGGGVDLSQLTELAMTMPFFSAHRLIIVEDSGLFRRGGQELAEALPHFPPETHLLFVETEVDARGKLFKAVKELGVVMKLDRQREEALSAWALKRLTREGRKIQRSAMQLFLERTGEDMQLISQELEKLVCYTQGRDAVMLEDVQSVTTQRTESRVFEMVDAIAAGKRERALKLYDDLLSARESPVAILALLSRQFFRLLQVKELRDQGMDIGAITEKTGFQNFVVRKAVGQGSRFTFEELRELLSLCARADEDIKRGRMKDTLAVELIIVKSGVTTR